MKFFAVHISDLESEAFTIASADQVATWLFLHALCAKQMNGGRIEGAKRMPPKFWQRHGIEAPGLLCKPSPLWGWEGDDLRLSPYDIEGESITAKKIEGGRKGGKARAAQRWRKNEGAESTPSRTPKGTGGSSPDAPDPISTQSELIESEQTTPPSPPRGRRRKGANRVIQNSPLMERIGGWFNRKPETKWTDEEARLLQEAAPSPDELESLEAYYSAKLPAAALDIRRKDIATLLRNWPGELDRAKKWEANASRSFTVDIGGRKPKTLNLDTPGS